MSNLPQWNYKETSKMMQENAISQMLVSRCLKYNRLSHQVADFITKIPI